MVKDEPAPIRREVELDGVLGGEDRPDQVVKGQERALGRPGEVDNQRHNEKRNHDQRKDRYRPVDCTGEPLERCRPIPGHTPPRSALLEPTSRTSLDQNHQET